MASGKGQHTVAKIPAGGPPPEFAGGLILNEEVGLSLLNQTIDDEPERDKPNADE